MRWIKSEKYRNIFVYFLFLLIIITNFVLVQKATAVVGGPSVDLSSDKTGNTPISAGESNLFTIITASQAKALGLGNCSIASGFLGNLASSMSGIASVKYKDLCSDLDSNITKAELTLQNQNTSVLSILSSLQNTVLDQRPASGVDYINEKVYAITNPGKIYAQSQSSYNPFPYYPGTGYDLLRPVQGFWGWSVNVVYGFLILLIIIVAFAIMFRQKLGGSAVVTLQNAIPSIALAMILVPLSYAISGLFIDAITVGTNVVHGFIIGPGSPGYTVYQNRNGNQTPDFNGNVTLPTWDHSIVDRGLYPDDERMTWLNARSNLQITESVKNASAGVINPIKDNVTIFQAIKTVLNLATGRAGKGDASATNPTGELDEAGWFGEIVNFIISILMIWVGVRILVKLLGKYLNLILMPIVAPFIFATAAIPGNGTKSIMQYIKTLAAASLFYIVTYAMFLLSFMFSNASFQASVPVAQSGAYVPPLLGLGSLTASGQGQKGLISLILTIVGIGIYFSIPKALEGIDAALGTKSAIPKFLTTPWESFQESWRVTTKAAPTLAARTAIAGGRLAKNVAYSPSRLSTAGYDILDRARGIDPETDKRSYRNRMRNKLANDMDSLKIAYKQAKSPVEKAKIQAQMTGVKLAGDRLGTGIGYQGDKEKKPGLKATFKWPGSPDNMIIFDNSQVATMRSIGGVFKSDPIGKIVFEVEGDWEFPNPTSVRIAGVTTIAGTSGETFDANNIIADDFVASPPPGGPLPPPIPSGNRPFMLKNIPLAPAGGVVDPDISAVTHTTDPRNDINQQIFAIYITEAKGEPSPDFKKYEVKFGFYVASTRLLLGGNPGSPNKFLKLGIINPLKSLVTDKIAFEVNGNTSAPMGITIGVSNK